MNAAELVALLKRLVELSARIESEPSDSTAGLDSTGKDSLSRHLGGAL